MFRTCRTAQDRTGYEKITGETPDVFQWLDFEFHDWVWFHFNLVGDQGPSQMGRWLGVSHKVGSDMCYWVLTKTGAVKSRTTVTHVTKAEKATEDIQRQMQEYDQAVRDRLNDENHLIDVPGAEPFFGITNEDDDLPPDGQDGQDGPVGPDGRGTRPEDEVMNGPDDHTEDTCDALSNAAVQPSAGGELLRGTVIKRAREEDGNPIETRHDNPLLNTRSCLVRVSDGSERECMHNVIAESMFAQADSEGQMHLLMDETQNHKHDQTAILKEDGWFTTRTGTTRRKKTTKG